MKKTIAAGFMLTFAWASPNTCPNFGLSNADHGTASSEVINGFIQSHKAQNSESHSALQSATLFNWQKIQENGKCGYLFTSSKDVRQTFKVFFK
jgi:hypothetical protein